MGKKMKNKNWTGNKKSIFVTLGASSHVIEEREKNDYYATEPKAIELLLDLEKFNENIWEPACGQNHISNVLKEKGYKVYCTDLIDRGYNDGTFNFLTSNYKWKGDIITNPPYKYAQEFVEKSLNLINMGNKVAMFLKLQFLEGQKRKKLFLKNPPKIIYVSSSRLKCSKNGIFKNNESSAVAYCWYIWEKGYTSDTIIKWFN